MKSLTKLRGSILFLSVFAVLLLYALFAYSAPQWVSGTNSTSPVSGAIYNPSANYSFQINWTDSDSNLANTTFQLGRPSGSLLNYTDIRDGLVGEWKLNAVNSTNGTKDFAKANDGVLVTGGETAASEILPGKIGNAFDFDGQKDYVGIPSSPFVSNFSNITVSLWFSLAEPLSAQTTSAGLLAKNNIADYDFVIARSGTELAAAFKNSTGGTIPILTSGFTPPVGTWYHLTWVFNSTHNLIYVDGKLNNTADAGANQVIRNTTKQLWIGRYLNANWFNGTIDEVRIYNRSLSDNEISNLYNLQYPYYAGIEDTLNGTWAINFTQDSIGGAGTYNYTWFATNTTGGQNSTQAIGYNISKAIPTITMSNTTNSVNTSGMIFYMPFMEGSGVSITEDKSGFGNNGTLTNVNATGNTTSGWTSGKYGSGLQFDGFNDYVVLSNSESLNQAFSSMSISFWFKTSESLVKQTDNAGFLSKTNTTNADYGIYVNGNTENIRAAFINDTGQSFSVDTSGFTPNLNEWYHVAWVYDGTHNIIYVNGKLNNSAAMTYLNQRVKSSSKTFAIGTLIGVLNFNGTIDEVMIYNRSLSDDEIKMQYDLNKYYPYASNVSASIDNSEQTLNLYRYENTSISGLNETVQLGAGQYWYIANASATENYTKIEALLPFGILQNNTNPIKLFFRNATSDYLNRNMTITYGSNSNTTALITYTQSGTLNLYYDDVLRNALNNTNKTIAAGDYKITANTSGNENYTSNTTTFWININKAATSIRLWLDNTEGNNTYNQNNVANFTAQLNVSRNITLSSNYTGFVDQTGTQTIFNYTTLATAGNFFNLTAFWNGDENYTASSATYFVNVNAVTPQEVTVTSGTGSSSSSTSGGLSAETKKKIEEENQRNLILDKESMKFNMIIGQTRIDTLKITNNKTEKISVALALNNLDKYAVLSEYKFELGPKESKIVSVTAVAGEKYGVFAGELVITDSVTKTIPIVLEVESAERLFDAKVDITSEYKKVLPGQDLKTQVTLLSMGPIEKKTDVTVQYSLKSASGNVLHEESETFAVERQKSFTKTFSIPSDTTPGDYILAIEVLYGNSFAVSSEMFKVVEKQEASVLPGVDYAWVVFLLAAIPVVAYVIKFRGKIFANNGRIGNSQRRKFLMQAKAISLMRFKTRESQSISKKRRNNQTHNAKRRRTLHDNF